MTQNSQQNKNKYCSFNELTENQNFCNFYGIIYDASFPKFNDNNQNKKIYRFECTIKLIDKDINCITSKENFDNNIINLIIKADLKEQIPYIHTICDIIRVQKGVYSKKIKRNVYLNFTNNNIKTSWCIFSGANQKTNEFSPILCSNSNYSFDQKDEIIIKELRTFIKENLIKENSLFYSYESKLNNRIIGDEQDVLIQILSKYELEDQMIYTIQDETDICELHTYKYFNFLEIGDVCRLRGYKLLEQNVIIMNQYSNILKIPKFTNYYHQFIQRLNNKKNVENEIEIKKDSSAIDMINNANLNGTFKIIESPKNILSSVENSNNFEIKHFDEIINENTFILDINLVNIEPENILEAIFILCNKCNKNFPYLHNEKILDNNLNYLLCPNCGQNNQFKLFFNFILFGIENIYSNKILIFHLCTYDGEGDNFLGIKPEEIVKENNNNLILLQNRIKLLTQKDNFIRILVEKIETENSNDEKKNNLFRIIGNYKNI